MRRIFTGLVEELIAIGKMVASGRGLCGERRLDAFRVVHCQRTIDLICRDVVEPLSLIFLRETLPVQLGGLKERQRPHHIRLRECERILDGTIDVALGGEVDYSVNMLVLHQLVKCLEIANIHLDEPVVRLVLDVLEIGKVSRIGQLVKIDDVVLGIFVHKQPHDVRSDEPGPAGDHDIPFCHVIFSLKCLN